MNATVSVDTNVPKFAPVMIALLPAGPEFGLRLAMFGEGAVIVNGAPLLPNPPTMTATLPLVAPLGTGTTILVSLQLVGAAAVPLNVTVLVACVAPKLDPVMVTAVPVGPDVGDRLVTLGVTAKETALLG